MSTAHALRFLNGLYKGVGAGFIEIRPLLDSSDPHHHTEVGARMEGRARRWFAWPIEAAACAEYCTSISGGDLHVYFGAALRRRHGGGTKADIGCATAVFADIDFKDVPKESAQEALRKIPFEPSICVRSGNGVHVYWLLRDPIYTSGFAELERVNREVLLAVRAQVGPQNVDRLLRVPGTANIKPKYGAPKPIAEVSHWKPDLSYRLEEFTAAFPPRPEMGPPKRAFSPAPASTLPAAELPEEKIRKMAHYLTEIWVTGFRHYEALHVGGWCAHAGFDEASAVALIQAVCEEASDEEASNRIGAVRDSYRKYEAGLPVAGFPALLELVKDSFPPVFITRMALVLEIMRGFALGARPRPALVSNTETET